MIGKLPVLEGRGTEYMSSNVSKRFFDKLTNLHKYNWVVLPGATDQDEELTKTNDTIVWLHVPHIYTGYAVSKYFTNKELTQNVKAYIVQSAFHKDDVVKNYKIDPSKVFILNNGFDPINYVKKPKKHVSLIYTAQLTRGLDILMKAFSQNKDPNISLTVHGCSCRDCLQNTEIPQDDRIRFVGFTKKSEYRQNLQRANLLIYPCRFQETAGIGIMEAMSAGVKIVSTDLGALPETTLGFAKLIPGMPIELEKQAKLNKKYIRIFKNEIKKAVKEIRQDRFDPQKQIEAVKKAFGWDTVEKQWLAFNSLM
jgi:glycosyltransferase involved in cell wall biosynthesis